MGQQDNAGKQKYLVVIVKLWISYHKVFYLAVCFEDAGGTWKLYVIYIDNAHVLQIFADSVSVNGSMSVDSVQRHAYRQ
jgi:hypothetical protein